MKNTSWQVDSRRILTRSEIQIVLVEMNRKRRRSINSHLNLMIFRLSTCLGLRASEIAGIRLGDVRIGSAKPHIRIIKSVGKGGKARAVPCWWDNGTLLDLLTWKELRIAQGAKEGDLFIASQAKSSTGNKLHRNAIRRRYKQACKILGAERVEDLTVHSGRHTFVSHALAGGRSLAEVRDAAGHCSIAITSIYTHVVHDDGEVGNLFGTA